MVCASVAVFPVLSLNFLWRTGIISSTEIQLRKLCHSHKQRNKTWFDYIWPLFAEFQARKPFWWTETIVMNRKGPSLLAVSFRLTFRLPTAFVWPSTVEPLHQVGARAMLVAMDTFIVWGPATQMVCAALSKRKVAGSIPGDQRLLTIVGPSKKAVFPCLATDVK